MSFLLVTLQFGLLSISFPSFPKHRFGIVQPTVRSCLVFFFELYPAIPNMIFKFHSLTFLFTSPATSTSVWCYLLTQQSSYVFLLSPLSFVLLSYVALLYFLLFCCILSNLMLSVLSFPLLLICVAKYCKAVILQCCFFFFSILFYYFIVFSLPLLPSVVFTVSSTVFQIFCIFSLYFLLL